MLLQLLKTPWLVKISYWVFLVGAIGLTVALINFIISYGFPYALNSAEELENFRERFRKHQKVVECVLKDYFSFLPPEKRDTVTSDFLDQAETILACKYFRISYIEKFDSCLQLLQRAIRRQDAFVHFSWSENEVLEIESYLRANKSSSETNQKILTKLIGLYGNHPLMTACGIDPLIIPEAFYQRSLHLSSEECIVNFFYIWAVEIERQRQFIVYQYDCTDQEQFELFFVAASQTTAFDKLVAELPSGDRMERFLKKPSAAVELDKSRPDKAVGSVEKESTKLKSK